MENYDRCKNCGKPTMTGFNFCPFCGTSLVENADETHSVQELAGTSIQQENNGVSTRQNVQNERIGQVANEVDIIELDEIVEIPLEEVKPADNVSTDLKEPVKTPSRKLNDKLFADKHVQTVFKHSLILLLCALMFAFSFCPIYSIEYGDFVYASNSEDTFDILPTDAIALMFATARNYDPEDDERKIERLEEDLIQAHEDFEESFKDDYNPRTEKYKLSAETKSLLRKYIMAYLNYSLSIKGNANVKIGYILAGIFCLINVLFSATMLALSVANLVFAIMRKDAKFTKIIAFIPLYLFLALAILFSCATTATMEMISGSLIACLFFSSLATVAIFAASAFNHKKVGNVKAIVFNTITLALAICVVGCCFAPSFVSSYYVTLKDRESPHEYMYESGNSVMASFIKDETDIEELDEDFDDNSSLAYEYYLKTVTEYLSDFSNYSRKYLYQNNALVFESVNQACIVNATLTIMNYSTASFLSAGYIVIPFILIAMGLFVCIYLFGGKRKSAALSFLVIAIVLLIIALVCTIVVCEAANQAMAENDLDEVFSLSLGGGLITAIILSFCTLISSAIGLTTRPKKNLA